jgi:hypothetical protein
MWITHGQPDRGAELAEKAEQHALAARGFYADGQFDRASNASERADHAYDSDEEIRFRVGVHLLAGRLERAARAAYQLADRWSKPPATASEAQRAWYADRAENARCLASAIDLADKHRAPPIWGYLNVLATMSGPCALLHADGLTGKERVHVLEVMRNVRPESSNGEVPAAWFELIGAESDPTLFAPRTAPFESAAEAIAVPSRGLALALPAVERNLAAAFLERRHENRQWRSERTSVARVEAYADASAAVFALLAGDAAEARRFARASEEALEVLARIRRADASAAPSWPLDALAATSLPADAQPARDAVRWPPLDPAVPHDAGGFLHGLLDYVTEHDAGPMIGALVAAPPPNEDEKEAWWLAAGGDGAGLAQWLARPTSQPGVFLRYGARFLGTGRTAVTRWVYWGKRPVLGFHPVEELVHLATLAEAAAALGGAEPFSLRASRFRAAILRRETAVPLAVLERL